MGIRLLNKFLQTKCAKTALKKIHLREYENKKIVIDIYNYLYRFKGDDRLIENLFVMCSIFRKYNISPIFVYDGKAPDIKQHTLKKRKQEKKKRREQYNTFLQQNQSYHTLEMINLRRSCSTLTKNDVELSKSLITSYGMSYIQSIGESDPLCVELVKTNVAYACLSDDMDMIAYGCPRVLRYFSLLKETVIEYSYKHILKNLNKIIEKDFTTLCILAGTDYGQFPKNIFLWYENYIQYMKSDKQDFIEYLIINQELQYSDIEIIETIRQLYYPEQTLNQYPFQSFKIKDIHWKGLRSILGQDNFMFSPQMIRCQ